MEKERIAQRCAVALTGILVWSADAAAQQVVVDNSPDTKAVPLTSDTQCNGFNAPGDCHVGDRFTLTEATTVTGAAIFTKIDPGLCSTVRFVVLPSADPLAVPLIDVETTVDAVDGDLTASIMNLKRVHATIAPQLLPAGDYFFYMAGVGYELFQATGVYDDDLLGFGLDANADLEFGYTLGGFGDAFFTIEAAPSVLAVDIDIKPGSSQNTVNLGSKGVTPVAILSSVDFDATTVDPLSVDLADSQVRVKGNGNPQINIQDVNGDGLLDLVLKMETEGFALTEGDVSATLTGSTFGGEDIGGSDFVRVVP